MAWYPLLAMLLVLNFSCEKKSSNNSSSGGGAQNHDNSQGDVVVTGTIALGSLDSAVTGADVVKLQGQEVAIVSPSGNTISKTHSSSDGSYAAIVPGSLVLDVGSETALALASGELVVQSVVTKTANNDVIGFRKPIKAEENSRVIKLGVTDYEKITAVRGRVFLDGALDHTGIVVYVPGTSYQARTDASGQFVMTFIPAGTYELAMEKDGFLGVSLSGVQVTENQTTSIENQVLKLSGGTNTFSVKQQGAPGYSKSRTVTFDIIAGNADRFKGGLAADLENKPYVTPPSTFSYDFSADGTFEIRMVFANADGFETTVSRTVIVDTVAPSSAGMALSDRKTLNATYTNERYVIPYHSTCNDMDAVAILPSTATAPSDSDFVYECYDSPDESQIAFTIPTPATSYSYKIWVRDVVGNISPSPATGTIQFDNTPPAAPNVTIADQTSGSTLGTDITTVNITINDCSDTQFILLSESQLLPPRPNQFSLACTTAANAYTYTFANNISGNKSVLVWAMDAAGNVGQIATVKNIALDQSAPISPAFTLADPTPANAGYANTTSLTAVPAHCNDVTHVLVSESQTTRPSEMDPNWMACTTSGVTVTAGGVGSRTFYLWARDIGGNVSLAATTDAIIIDTVAPALPSFAVVDQTNFSSTYTNSATVGIAIGSCAGADKVLLTESTTTPAESSVNTSCSTSGITHTFSNTSDGSKTLYLWVRDLAGNISGSYASASITLDTGAPALPGTFSLADTTTSSATHTNATTVNYTLSDCPAGARIYFGDGQSTAPSENSGGWQACSTSGTFSLTASDGLRSVYLWVRDDAGNINGSSLSHSITLDTAAPSAPSITLTDASGGASSGYTDNLTVNVTVASCSDVDKMLLTESSTPPAEGSISTSCSTTLNGFNWSFTGSEETKRLYIWTKDQAGNVNTSASYADIYYDSSTPVLSNIKVTEVGTDRFTVTWGTDETIPTNLIFGTSSGSYTLNYNNPVGNTTHSGLATSLSDNTSYYWKAKALDFAEHAALSAESSVKTFKLTTVINSENQAKFGGRGSDGGQGIVMCDVNADGKDDLVVGAPYSGYNGANSGAVYVFFGNATVPTNLSPSGDASILYYGGAGENIGNVGCLDFNGDGKKDLLIMDAVWQSTTNWYIVHGSTTIATGAQNITTARNQYGTFTYAHDFATGGDIDGDGYEDFVICGSSITGCSVFYGSTSASSISGTYNLIWNSSSDLGQGIAIANIDGDAYADILLGRGSLAGENNGGSNNGAIFIKRGNSIRPSATINMHSWTPSVHPVDYEVHGGVNSMGIRYVYAGNLDGDGFDDILAQASNGDLYIVWGRSATSVGGTDWVDDPYISIASADLRFTGLTATNYNAVAIIDADGDGKKEVLLGNPNASGGGQVCLFMGKTRADWINLATAGAIPMSKADLCVKGADTGDELGGMVTFGDFNNDGKKEIVFGNAMGDGTTDTGTNTGEAGVLYWNLPTLYENLSVLMSPHY